MKVSKKVIQDVVNKVVASVLSVDLDRLQLAKDLRWANNVINWRFTQYNSWDGFCKAEVKMAKSAIYDFMMVAEKVEEFRYTDSQCHTMIKAIGWTAFKFGLFDMVRKISVSSFIKQYASGDRAEYGSGTTGKGDRAYTFSLPKRQADKLDAVLKSYGMSVHEKGRRGVRSAMIKLINRKL